MSLTGSPSGSLTGSPSGSLSGSPTESPTGSLSGSLSGIAARRLGPTLPAALLLAALLLVTLLLAALLLTACPRSLPPPGPPHDRAPVPPPRLTVRFFAAGNADSILLSTSAGHRVLVDAGLAMEGNHLVRRRLLRFFREQRIKKLDYFVVTHPHPDHFGDPVQLRRRVAFPSIHTNADGAVLLRTLTLRLRLAAGSPVSIVTLRQGDHLELGRLQLRVLSPSRAAKPPLQVSSPGEQNERSLVLMAQYGSHRFLLAADLGYAGERTLLDTGLPLRADVLKLGHHGQGSTSDAWLRRVRPKFAVATCGHDALGSRRELSRALLTRLNLHKVKLLRTDRHGDVVFETDGRNLRWETYPSHVFRPRPTIPAR
ncbi:MAG: MBL fold metallo-hydrolase [bacterium]